MRDHSQRCPLCGAAAQYYGDYHKRRFFECAECYLISSDRTRLLNPLEERDRYLLHQYDETNQGYLEYLDAVIKPARQFISRSGPCLDYGSGPACILAKVLADKGYQCESFDPFFIKTNLKPPYDTIFSTEVFEHFNAVSSEIAKLLLLLSKGGILAVMTQFNTAGNIFGDWHYIRDKTHLSFYSIETLHWIKNKFDLEILFCDNKRVVIYRKN